METNTQKPEVAKVAATDKTAEEAKKRNPSSTYTIKSMGQLVKKLESLKMVTKEELEQLQKIHKAVVTRWIGGEIKY